MKHFRRFTFVRLTSPLVIQWGAAGATCFCRLAWELASSFGKKKLATIIKRHVNAFKITAGVFEFVSVSYVYVSFRHLLKNH